MSSTKLQNRVNFGKIKHLAETPDLLEVQIQSFKEFFQLETTPTNVILKDCSRCSRKIFLSLIPGTFSCWNFWIILLIRHATLSKSVWNVD